MFTVMVAAMHRTVFAVDPLIINLAFIDHSLKRANNSQYVSLINNPIRWECTDTILSYNWTLTMMKSDSEEILFPVSKHKDNAGNTKLYPSHLLNENLKRFISGDSVVSCTLHQLVRFAGASTIVVKLDVEVKIYRNYFTLIWYL